MRNILTTARFLETEKADLSHCSKKSLAAMQNPGIVLKHIAHYSERLLVAVRNRTIKALISILDHFSRSHPFLSNPNPQSPPSQPKSPIGQLFSYPKQPILAKIFKDLQWRRVFRLVWSHIRYSLWASKYSFEIIFGLWRTEVVFWVKWPLRGYFGYILPVGKEQDFFFSVDFEIW